MSQNNLKIINVNFFARFLLFNLITFSLFVSSFNPVKAKIINFDTAKDWQTGLTSNVSIDEEAGSIMLDSSGTWGARNWKTPDAPFAVGSAFATDGTNIYAIRGAGDVLFWKYNPSQDKWTDLANLPRGTYYGSDLEYLNGYIYILFGGYQKTFGKYSVENNTWELLADLPEYIYDGGSLATDGTTLFVLRGTGSQDFYEYNIENNTWNVLPGPPASISRGADLVYDNGFFYTPRGVNTNSFYRYNISSRSWTTMSNLPTTAYDDVNITTDGEYIYLARQYNTKLFYKYDIERNLWSSLTDLPSTSYYGGTLYNPNDGYVYVFRANGSYDFWKYNPVTDSFLGYAEMPVANSTGSDLFYHNNYLYVPRGSNSSTFNRLNLSTNVWEGLTNVPTNLNDDTKGVLVGNDIYFLKGSNTSLFYKYSITTNTWTQLTDTLATVNQGGGTLSYPGSGDYIYATRGNYTLTFWRYSISANTWETLVNLPTDAYAAYGSRLISDEQNIYYLSGGGVGRFFRYDTGNWVELASPPFSPYYGTDITYDNGKFYALAGYYKTDLLEYTISTDAWRKLKPASGYYAQSIGAWAGAAIRSNGNGNLFITYGNGKLDLLSYAIDSLNYVNQGYWDSGMKDLGYVSAWGDFNFDIQNENNTSVLIQTRTSADGINWEAWQNLNGQNIQSSLNRFFQVRAILNSSSNNENTPIIRNISLSYVGDNNPPINASQIEAKSVEVAGTTLINAQSYKYRNPYFSWSGDSDLEGSIAGYFVYFGINSEADPEISGSYQLSNDYSVTQPLNTGTYYLKIKTKDDSGNISDSATLFEYVYEGISPHQSLTVTNSSEFLGDSENINISNDKLSLSSKIGGFWLEQTMSLTPAGLSYGAKTMAYVSSSSKFYIFQGGNGNAFYSYDLSTDTWSTLANAPTGVYIGGGVIEGPEGYLYGMSGNNTTSFWRYNIESNTWSDEDAADLPLTAHYGGSMVFDGSQYIYVLRGNNEDSFWRYDTFNDMWQSLATTDFDAPFEVPNNNVYAGGDLTIDKNGKKIYIIQGNLYKSFAVYDINSNSWSSMPDLPALPYLGASVEYDEDLNKIFYLPGYNTDLFFELDLTTQEWSQKSSTPMPFYYGANLRKVGVTIYGVRGSGSRNIYKYSPKKDSWQIPNRGIFGEAYRGTAYFTVQYGADILKGDGNNFYISRGNLSDDFYRWNEVTGETTKLSRLPVGAYNGTSFVYDSVNNLIYMTGYYNIRTFYVYSIENNSWSEISTDPPPLNTNYGSSMVFDPSSGAIYLNRGGVTANVYKYDTNGSAGSRWTSIANAPVGLGYGAELLIEGNYIYTLRGQNVNNNAFYRYSISQNLWQSMSPLSIDVYNDGFLTRGREGIFYASKGDNMNNFYSYSVQNDSWSDMTKAPADIYIGGSGESNGVDKIYALAGPGTNSISDGLYTYVMQTDESGFEESGSYITQIHDLSAVYKWSSLDLVYQKPINTSLIIKTRTSTDYNTWTSWTAVSEEKNQNNNYSYKINSPPNRYLQIKFDFESLDGVKSVNLDSYTINYYKDESSPTNPTLEGLGAYSSNTGGQAILSGNWYGYSSPFFDWPEAESTNGASDSQTGSGVSGYYVYFGPNQSADPKLDGNFQIQTEFVPTNLVNGQTYYLRIKTSDDAGNLSEQVWEPFIYKYDSEPPSKPTQVNSDPSGYSATNSFDFSWNESSASGSPITGYCYKTGESEGSFATDQCSTNLTVSDVSAYKVGANTFYVRSQDAAGNFSEYSTAQYYYVDSDNAPAPPTNLTVSPATNTENSFAFSWDPPTAGTFYGSAANLSYYYSINALPTARSTTATSLKNLLAGAYATLPGENVFYVVTKDEAGNINYNNYASVTFTADTTAPGIPLNLDIADVSVKSTKSWKLALSWEKPSSGGEATSYAIYQSIDGETFKKIATSGGISYVDVGLIQQTYYYKVKACDSTNNCGEFSEIVKLFPDGKFVTPAELISEPVASQITTKKATVSWATSRTSDSRIAFGTSSGDYFEEEVSNSQQVASHVLNLSNLSPGTKYYYVARWTDEDGNIGESEEITFETEPPPTTEEPTVKNVGLDSALIEFISKNAARVRVYFGESSAFGGVEDIVTGSGEGSHTVLLKDLTDGTKYYYKINSFDSEGAEYEGEIHSFITLQRPKISNIKINQVKGTAKSTLLVTWQSNTPTSSIVTYYPVSAPSLAKDEVNIVLKGGKHQMVLHNLEPQTTYGLIIKGKDAAGNEALGEIQQISTSADTRPPQILNLKVESEITGVGEEASAQLVVSYSTDELATAQVEYGEGSGTVYSQKSQEDSSLTNNHLVVISELSPGKVYHLRVVSKDVYGNKAESLDKVVISPKATENALDLVVNSLSSTFGFLRKN